MMITCLGLATTTWRFILNETSTRQFLFERSRVNFLGLMPKGLRRDWCKNRIHYGRFNGLAYVFNFERKVFAADIPRRFSDRLCKRANRKYWTFRGLATDFNVIHHNG